MLVWGSCGAALFSELEKIHVRAAKWIYGLDWLSPWVEVFLQTKWKSLKQMYIRRILCFVFKCVFGYAPFHLRHLWSKHESKYNFLPAKKELLGAPQTEYGLR